MRINTELKYSLDMRFHRHERWTRYCGEDLNHLFIKPAGSPLHTEISALFFFLAGTPLNDFFFNVLLTVHLSIFILVINQLDARNLFYSKFISCLYMFRVHGARNM